MSIKVILNVNAVSPERSRIIERILQAALDAADPYTAVGRILQREGDNLVIAGKRYQPGRNGRVFVYGFGKASLAMARSVSDLLGGQINRGAIIVKHIPETYSTGYLEILKGNHPIPGEDSLYSTRKLLLSIPDDLNEADLVICLISGGGSALLTMPAQGIYIEELQETTSQLLTCGASIQEVNTVRKHLDLLKGGGLWALLQPAQTSTLILSDVVGDNLEAIASGPMTPDPTTYEDAWDVIKKYKLEAALPPNVISYFQARLNDHNHETLKKSEYNTENSQVMVIGSNRQASEAALQQARVEGFCATLAIMPLILEARLAADIIIRDAAIDQNTAKNPELPSCMIYGGETTVTLKGKGLGGRNLETALASVRGLSGTRDLVLITFATDGDDGPTGAAGAVVTSKTYKRGVETGILPNTYLEQNDSYHYFEQLGDLIVTGPTGTNVNDLSILLEFDDKT